MRKKIIYLIVLVLLALVLLEQKRTFYCLSEKRCVTVWKRVGDVCYIIPGKYCGLLKPSENFLRTDNGSDLTLYFSDELPNALVYRTEDPLIVVGGVNNDFTFYDYKSDEGKFDSILYPTDAKRHKDVRTDVQFMDLNILENAAWSKNGEVK